MNGLSIIIPVKLPEPYLQSLINQIHIVLNHVNHEILVQTEPGLTNAVVKGVWRSTYDIIAVMDADGSHDPEALLYMYYLMNDYELVIGSKVGGLDETSRTRRFISQVYRWFARTLLKITVRDPMSGFVVATKKLFQHVKPSSDYKFLLQLLMSKPTPHIYEFPILFRKRQGGTSKAGLRTGLKTFTSIITLWREQR